MALSKNFYLLGFGIVLVSAYLLGKSTQPDTEALKAPEHSHPQETHTSQNLGSHNSDTSESNRQKVSVADATLLSSEALEEWQHKAKEKNPQIWNQNLAQLISACKQLPTGARYRLFLDFLSSSETTKNAQQFSDCAKIAFSSNTSIRNTICDLDGTSLDAELASRNVKLFLKEGKGDALYLSLADQIIPKNDTDYAVANLASMCDPTRQTQNWSAHDIKDEKVKALVHETLFQRWLSSDRLQSARAFLDQAWIVSDAPKAAEDLFDFSWFSNNANVISTLIRDAPVCSRRNLLVEKMVAALKLSDPVAAAAWQTELK